MGESQTFLVVRARLNFWASWAVAARLAMSAMRVNWRGFKALEA